MAANMNPWLSPVNVGSRWWQISYYVSKSFHARHAINIGISWWLRTVLLVCYRRKKPWWKYISCSKSLQFTSWFLHHRHKKPNGWTSHYIMKACAGDANILSRTSTILLSSQLVKSWTYIWYHMVMPMKEKRTASGFSLVNMANKNVLAIWSRPAPFIFTRKPVFSFHLFTALKRQKNCQARQPLHARKSSNLIIPKSSPVRAEILVIVWSTKWR